VKISVAFGKFPFCVLLLWERDVFCVKIAEMTSLIKNKKAFYNYHISEKMEAGLILEGKEVKSLREGKASLSGSYITIKKGECFLVNCNISPYQPNNISKDYDPRRDRKLLIKKKEIDHLFGKMKEKGTTLIPLKIYIKRNLLKVEIGVAKGKKKYDKREAIKKRDIDRDLKRKIKR